MSTEFNSYVLQKCFEGNFPCIPDVNDPIVSTKFIAMAWMGYEGPNDISKVASVAEEKGLVVCEIKRQKCIRLSDAKKLVVDDEEGSTKGKAKKA